MATPTFVSTLTTINNANATAGWAITSATPDPDIKKEGTNSVSGILRADQSTGIYTSGTAINLANQHLRLWIQFAAVGDLDFIANGGIEMSVSDGTNTAYWAVLGIDTYSGGWFNGIVDYNSTPTSGTKPTGTVTQFGVRFNRTSAPAQKINTWLDYLRYGDGYQITGGTSGDPLFITDITTYDAFLNGGTTLLSNGITVREQGVNFLYGRLIFGNDATTTYVDIENEVLIFTESPVSSTLYQFKAVGSGCTLMVANSVIKSSGTNTNSRFLFDMSDSGLASFTLSASSIIRANQVIFKSGQTVTGSAFTRCGPILPKGSTFTENTISNSTETTGALVLDSTADIANMSDCTFTDNTIAIKITAAGTYNFNGLTFTNNTTQVDFTGTGTCTIVPSNGSNVTQGSVTASGGGTITVETPAVNVVLTGLIADSEVRAYVGSSSNPAAATEIGGVESSGTSFTFSQSVGGQVGYIQIFHVRYQPVFLDLTYSSESQTIPIQQIFDRQYDIGTISTPG